AIVMDVVVQLHTSVYSGEAAASTKRRPGSRSRWSTERVLSLTSNRPKRASRSSTDIARGAAGTACTRSKVCTRLPGPRRRAPFGNPATFGGTNGRELIARSARADPRSRTLPVEDVEDVDEGVPVPDACTMPTSFSTGER